MSTLVELVNKGWTNNNPRNNNSLKGFNSYSLKEELKSASFLYVCLLKGFKYNFLF